MMGHKICYYGEIWIIIPKLSSLPLHIWTTGLIFNLVNFITLGGCWSTTDDFTTSVFSFIILSGYFHLFSP